MSAVDVIFKEFFRHTLRAERYTEEICFTDKDAKVKVEEEEEKDDDKRRARGRKLSVNDFFPNRVARKTYRMVSSRARDSDADSADT